MQTAHAISLDFLLDDAFISFRYAQNLVEGHGLVFNPGGPGEPVEGYTNFLWVLLMAAGMVVGIEPELLSRVLGLACFAAGLLAVAVPLGRQSFRHPSTALLAVAAVAVNERLIFYSQDARPYALALLVFLLLEAGWLAASTAGRPQRTSKSTE